MTKRFIKCRVCGSIIPQDTNFVYTPCECGAIAVDGGKDAYCRIIGGMENWEICDDEGDPGLSLKQAMVNGGLTKGFADARRYIDAGAVFVNGQMAWGDEDIVFPGDEIMLGKHKIYIVEAAND